MSREGDLVEKWWETQVQISGNKASIKALEESNVGLEDAANEYVSIASDICSPAGALYRMSEEIFVAAIENDNGNFNFHILKCKGTSV